MQLFKKETTINFIGNRKIAIVFSCLMMLASGYSLFGNGLNYGIDFTGGTKIELVYQQDVPIGDVRSLLETSGYQDSVVQYFGSNKDILVRIPLSEANSSAAVSTDIVKLLSSNSVQAPDVRSVEFVGPQFGKE
ncbi:MAG: protein translocase subunit SecF, partial [Gammaproteobacteria bacterium]|nr:protein translocase subunit SecF [Gammaproteobacteria bacterium]